MNRYYYYYNFMNYKTEALGSLIPSAKSPLSALSKAAVIQRHKHTMA